MKNSGSPRGLLDVLIESAEIIQNGVMWLNEEGHILGINEIFASELGYSKANFSPKTIFEVNPTTSMLTWKRLWKSLLEDNQITFETEQITSDDAIYPVKMRGVYLDLSPEPVCMCIIENLMRSNRYKDLLNLTTEVAGIGCWEWDLVNDEIIFSTEMYHLMDIRPNTLITKNKVLSILESRLVQEDKSNFNENLTKAIKEGTPVEMEVALETDSEFVDFHIHIHPVVLEGKTIKLYGIFQNLAGITQRSDDMYFTKYCLDHALDMIYWIGADGIIRYVNQAACRKLGYEADTLIGKNIAFLSPGFTIDWDEHYKELKKNKSLELEAFHVSNSGRKIPVSIVANYINYRGREFNCAFVRDLSKQKRSSVILKMAKLTLDNSVDMIFWLNPDGSFRYFNKAFIAKSGYSKEELRSFKVYDLFPDSSLDKFKAGWKKLQKGHLIRELRRDLKTKSGKIIPTEMSVFLINIDNVEYSTTLLRDITERRNKEEQIREHLENIELLQKATEEENIELKKEIDLNFNFENIISVDPNYKKVLKQVEQVAATDATTLILGETGTGKELLARSIHQLSPRAKMPLIKINCGALPPNLIESEFFGHEKGAFTGAYNRKTGKFERAHKGTIFLDEIGELPLDLQSKLLRVLQEGEIERVGGTETIVVDVRVIAATNRNLEDQVRKGLFREDLYYRLNVFPIYNIPLRERRKDIPPLVKYFADKYSKKINKQIDEISQKDLAKLMAYDFAGNVRELENIVERAVILSKGKVLKFDINLAGNTPAISRKFKSLEEIQKQHIIRALKRTNGKVSGPAGAAELLGINNKTLTSRMKKLGINKKAYTLT